MGFWALRRRFLGRFDSRARAASGARLEGVGAASSARGPQLLGQGLGVGGVDVHGFLLWLLWAGVHRCVLGQGLGAAQSAGVDVHVLCAQQQAARFGCCGSQPASYMTVWSC